MPRALRAQISCVVAASRRTLASDAQIKAAPSTVRRKAHSTLTRITLRNIRTRDQESDTTYYANSEVEVRRYK